MPELSPDPNFSLVDPRSIIVQRDQRQRREIKTGDLKDSIAKYGVLNPVIVKVDPIENHFVLISGERRLQSCLELIAEDGERWKDLRIPVRFFETLTPTEASVIELEENIKREDLPWRDRVKAIGKLHELKLSEDQAWTTEQTGELISYSKTMTTNLLIVYRSLESPAIATADNLSHALGILQRIAERRTASIVEELIRATTVNVPVSPEIALQRL